MDRPKWHVFSGMLALKILSDGCKSVALSIEIRCKIVGKPDRAASTKQ